MEGVKHYLIDVLEPSDEFNIVVFQKMAKEALNEIYANGQVPIIAGGTGFYIQALLYDIDFENQDCNEEYRTQLEQLAKEQGNEALHARLQEIDPVSAQKIHANNVKRVIRALEFYHLTGKPISEHNEAEHQKESPYNFAYFVLNDEREHLYERIDKRVDIMVEHGLLEEVKKLKDMGYHRDMVSMQGLGYKEILDYLDGKCSFEEAIYIIKRETRHFAKRQLTWFRREREVIWMDKSKHHYDETAILDEMYHILKTKEIVKE